MWFDRHQTEQCRLAGFWDLDPQVHSPEIRLSASRTQEDYSLWTKWHRKNLPGSKIGWASGSQVIKKRKKRDVTEIFIWLQLAFIPNDILVVAFVMCMHHGDTYVYESYAILAHEMHVNEGCKLCWNTQGQYLWFKEWIWIYSCGLDFMVEKSFSMDLSIPWRQ